MCAEILYWRDLHEVLQISENVAIDAVHIHDQLQRNGVKFVPSSDGLYLHFT